MTTCYFKNSKEALKRAREAGEQPDGWNCGITLSKRGKRLGYLPRRQGNRAMCHLESMQVIFFPGKKKFFINHTYPEAHPLE